MNTVINRVRIKILLSLLVTTPLVACTSANPEAISGSADNTKYDVIPVTPQVVAQLQQEVSGKYTAVNHLNDQMPLHAAPYNYRIGPGDILYAKLFLPSAGSFEGDMSGPYPVAQNWQEYNEVIVKDDGNVSFPYVGEVHFAGKTLAEAKQTLDHALAVYFKHPQSVLEIKDFKSNKINVTGEVQKPGEQYLQFAPLDVLGAVNAAGGLKNTADLKDSKITHKDGSVDKINLSALINGGDTTQNRTLVEGDSLHIPANYGNKVYVIGEVNKPTMQYIEAGHMTVMEALNSSQGLNSLTASFSQIYIIRGMVGQPTSTEQTAAATMPASLQTASASDVSPPLLKPLASESSSNAQSSDSSASTANASPSTTDASVPGKTLIKNSNVYSASHDSAPAAGDSATDAKTQVTNPPAANTPAQLYAHIYHLNASTGDGIAMAAQFPLEPNDVIYVSPTSISLWNVFISQLVPNDIAALAEAGIITSGQ